LRGGQKAATKPRGNLDGGASLFAARRPLPTCAAAPSSGRGCAVRTTLTHVRLEPNTRRISWNWLSNRLIWIAGIALIALGIVCLYLSDAVVTGWWQGTLEAFGVGFIVGGLIDVLALSGLTRILNTEERQRTASIEDLNRSSQQRPTVTASPRAEARRRADRIREQTGWTPETIEEALQILEDSWPYLDQPRRDEVLRLLYLPPAAWPPDHGHPGTGPVTG